MRFKRVITSAGLALLACAVIAASLWGLALARGAGSRVLLDLLARSLVTVAGKPPAPLYISGSVFANDLKQQEAGRSVPTGIAATVTCNGAHTLTDSDGGYSLRVAAAQSYQCSVSAGDGYTSVAVVFSAPATGSLDVNFGPQPTNLCAPLKGTSTLMCPMPQLRPGTLGGVVTSADTHQPLAGIQVECWNPTGGTTDSNPLKYFNAETDAQGAYTLANLPVDRYACNAQTDWRLHTIAVAPHAPAALDIRMCQAHCPAVHYHNGAVMHTYTAYLIFWLPSGYTYDALGDGNFERIVSNYINDVGGSAYYNIATQYWDFSGPIQNNVTLGGTWVDTQPYPRAATRSSPLSDGDIQNEVSRAATANHWTSDTDHAFFVFTGYNAQICTDSAHFSCSFGASGGIFCGYHNDIGGNNTIYAEIVDNSDCVGPLSADAYDGPNGDRVADWIVDTVAHEQLESATDPLVTGWYDGSQNEGEVGDKCENDLGYVQLGHGHTYYIQAIWSNTINGCAFGM